MNYEHYKRYIVVDENNRPMSFLKDQFCYTDTEESRNPFSLQSYTLEKARELIKKTIEYRTANNYLSPDEQYILMPICKKLKNKNQIKTHL
jgi:hypothetical protein